MLNLSKRCIIAWLALPMTLSMAQSPGDSGKRITAIVDASRTAPPMSPYLYGQFIEHIADTVNRSLWA